MTSLAQTLTFTRGPAMANRFMLAPLTNLQSHPDGTLSDDEIGWLVKRAEGGFATVMTAAAHVQAVGQGFPGQLGIFSDDHLPGLTRLAGLLRDRGAVSAVQLHHAGMRSPADLIGTAPVGPFADEATGTRALTTEEVERLRDDFIAAAVRAETAGFDGVEVHGAHGYVLAQFLDPAHNLREDRYGGSFENRTRLIREVIEGIRGATRADFQLGLRLSPERFDIVLDEAKAFAQDMMLGGQLDYLDMSLWDCFKQPEEEAHKGQPLISHFTALERGNTRLGVAGKIMSASKAQDCLDAGADFVLVGRGAILHHDFPRRAIADADFACIANPVTREHLKAEALGDAFVAYLSTWPGFVAEPVEA
ncbi:2,4-dienoyl-CoA reductase-like NADH-dependent reductase (Old Yellow Enzyme family) [Novosphingobium kunmingense]|uniref:2,4-dienoyl-CoA reductase-like NADH-dependent reductase (Old Yellow Enzyme family) n=1 Tax=Novosphingobium kunmingense TaxID=1211806 RepID=A0A2N0I3Z3_9SPHN|nr:NADH:flavin oxidoreductase [Novosphingobium kunmingense]PKB25876.1 2,4-dienoyl-CoA reductase-like NADH-dependent reductase (Old Yellow Enzyme family) [Novosphingobium kunmingense]